MSGYEIIGLIGTGFIVLCFTFDDQKKIRIFDMIGSVLFVVYGILMGTVSNVVLNGVLIIIHIHKLRKMKKLERQEQWQDIQKHLNGQPKTTSKE